MPALLGGTPIRTAPMPQYNTIGAAEKAAVMDVLDSGELSGFIASPGKEFWGGPAVQRLEQAFCEKFAIKHAVSVNSATSGLHVALAATGIGPGDEVIVPPYTMSASATTVLFTGAVPIFADIEDDYFCLDINSVIANLTPATKAIVAVNLFGHPAALVELRALADDRGLFLIEDNSQGPGALCDGKYTATIGHAGIFSFNRHKTMQSGEGGVVTTNEDDFALKMQLVRNHGEVVVGPMGIKDLTNTPGLNYRMTEMEAAVARVQFGRLDELNNARIELANRLTEGLSQIAGLTPPKVRENCSHVYYFYPIKFDEAQARMPRDLFTRAVQAEGFMLRPGYVKPIYLEPMYRELKCFGNGHFPFSANARWPNMPYDVGTCPVVERMSRELMVTNIVYPPLTLDVMDSFVEACRKVLESKDDLLASEFAQSA